MSRETDDYDNMPSWNDDTGFADHFDDENDCSDVDESNTLVSQPRQVCFHICRSTIVSAILIN